MAETEGVSADLRWRGLYDCTRRWPEGRVEQLGGVCATIHYPPGTRIPHGAHIEMLTRIGSRLQLDVESKVFAPIAFGSGYGGDSSWAHGTWKGGPFAERVSYDMTDPDLLAQAPFSQIDHVGRAVCTEADGSTQRGAGLFEPAGIGPHHPAGFHGWTDVSGAAS